MTNNKNGSTVLNTEELAVIEERLLTTANDIADECMFQSNNEELSIFLKRFFYKLSTSISKFNDRDKKWIAETLVFRSHLYKNVRDAMVDDLARIESEQPELLSTIRDVCDTRLALLRKNGRLCETPDKSYDEKTSYAAENARKEDNTEVYHTFYNADRTKIMSVSTIPGLVMRPEAPIQISLPADPSICVAIDDSNIVLTKELINRMVRSRRLKKSQFIVENSNYYDADANPGTVIDDAVSELMPYGYEKDMYVYFYAMTLAHNGKTYKFLTMSMNNMLETGTLLVKKVKLTNDCGIIDDIEDLKKQFDWDIRGMYLAEAIEFFERPAYILQKYDPNVKDLKPIICV